MPPRPRGKFHRGGGMRGGYGGGWERGHGGRGGGGGYRGRGRGGGHRGGRPDYYHGRRDSRSPPPRQHNDPEKLLAGLGPEAQLALTTAIINSVLKTDGREGRGSYRERERPHHRDARRDGRGGGGGYFREESRERRHYGDERRSHDPRPYHEEGRGHRYEREKPPSGSPRYRNNRYSGMPRRRPSPHGHPGPSRKRQRVERMDSGESGSASHHERDFEGEDSYEQERERERPRDRRYRSPGVEEQRKGRDSEGSKVGDDKEEGPDGPSGVQVTIKADGERAVNSEVNVRSRVGPNFVELRCPHCPSQKSITFKEYKFHLGSDGHKNQLNRLARKHSVVLRKIRIQQRQEQREIEEKWKEEKPEEFKKAVSKFCSTCKLAFKCLSNNVNDGNSTHNRSKLHRMQRHYLHPRCIMCRITFPSRMVYEYHIASINHLRVRTATIDNDDGEQRSDDEEQEEDDDVLDLTNFMTLDSVGEDDEEVGSEHEEITEGLDEVEAAEEVSRRKHSSKSAKHRKGHEDDEISVGADWDKEQLEDDDEEEEAHEAVGTDYVTRIEAYYCALCAKIIRGDTAIGSRSVQRHCRSFDHLANYQEAHPPPVEEEDNKSTVQDEDKDEHAEVEDNEEVEDEGEPGNLEVDEGEEGDTEGEDEGDGGESRTEEDPEQEKLWEEVDEGLSALQGEIMNEIGGDNDDATEKSKTEKIHVDQQSENEKSEDEEESGDGDEEDAESNTENDNEDQDDQHEKEKEAETLDESKEDEVGDGDDDDDVDDNDDDNDNTESPSPMEVSKEEVGKESDGE